MRFNNKITVQSVDNGTGQVQTIQPNASHSCIRSKWTWIIFAISIIFIVTIPTTIILTRKQTSTTSEPATTTSEITTTTSKTTTTTSETTTTIVATEMLLVTTQGIDMITDITVPSTPSIPFCKANDCRAAIAYRFANNLSFNTTQLDACTLCPYMSFTIQGIGFSEDWSLYWPYKDFHIKNSIGQDCENNPSIGTLVDCVINCFKDMTCAGFSRRKKVLHFDRTGECWLKTNITVNKTPEDPDWFTAVFQPIP